MEHIKILFLQYYRGQHTEICPRNIFEITGKKSGYGITHSINSLLWLSLSMEPKSIAFYTAVAVSILAVLSATTFPTLAQAQTADEDEQTQQRTQQEDEEPSEPGDMQDSTEGAEEGVEGSADENSEDTSESLGLSSDNGRVTCGQVITEPNMEVSLTGDLNCGDQDEIIVNAENVHVLLNGYRITGNAVQEYSTEDPTMDYYGSTGILVNGDAGHV